MTQSPPSPDMLKSPTSGMTCMIQFPESLTFFFHVGKKVNMIKTRGKVLSMKGKPLKHKFLI